MTADQISSLIEDVIELRDGVQEAFTATQRTERAEAYHDAFGSIDDLIAKLDAAWVDALRREVA